ncbi:MAG: hypothetical protein C00003105_01591 [ANME-2 cluster archaeon HR1]|nr:MAG: hypothetical protein C00003105_01591 [ANME-2 cluster archaeon HR1]
MFAMAFQVPRFSSFARGISKEATPYSLVVRVSLKIFMPLASDISIIHSPGMGIILLFNDRTRPWMVCPGL